jgi:REP element-mobilizing transposase RayT
VSYWRIFYHLIWATKQREPLLGERVEAMVYGTILHKAKELDIIVHAIGGVEDHVHLTATIPPKLAIAEGVRQLKGASSYYVNQQGGGEQKFMWQDGYGVLTLGERSMPDLVKYVKDQRQHHNAGTIIPIFERIDENES